MKMRGNFFELFEFIFQENFVGILEKIWLFEMAFRGGVVVESWWSDGGVVAE